MEASSSPLLFLKFKCFISCPGFILLCWAGVSHISTPSMVVLLRKTLFLVNCLGVPDDSQVQMSSQKLRSPSNFPGVEVNWTFFIICSFLRWRGFCPSPVSCPPLEGGTIDTIEGADQSHPVI